MITHVRSSIFISRKCVKIKYRLRQRQFLSKPWLPISQAFFLNILPNKQQTDGILVEMFEEYLL